MFATIVSAVRSRGAVALVGATTTGLALRSRSKWKDEAKYHYSKCLMEEAKVTELKSENQMIRRAICHTATVEPVEEPAETAAEKAVAIASLSAMLSFMCYAAIVVAIGRNSTHPF
jgi:hypothetical protein